MYKFPNRNVLKIQFFNTNTAENTIESGILGFHMSIPDYNIKTDEYISITT